MRTSKNQSSKEKLEENIGELTHLFIGDGWYICGNLKLMSVTKMRL